MRDITDGIKLPKTDLPITVERIPDHQHYECKVTICMTWELARILAELAGPLIASMSKSVDMRTGAEKERDRLEELRRRRWEVEERKHRARMFSVARSIYREGISYAQALDRLEVGGHVPYTKGNAQLRAAYKKARRRASERMRAAGQTNRMIADFWGISPQGVSQIFR